MNILIVGGTRFLGKKIVEILAEKKHNLTVLSRHLNNFPQENIIQICKERDHGLIDLKGCSFDLTLDFIGYDGNDPIDLLSIIETKGYVLISSTWVPRLWRGVNANELLSSYNLNNSDFEKKTIDYLKGKANAENAIMSLRKKGYNSTILRLPITLGEGDHTGRFNFYPDRLIDGNNIILVDRGQNKAQIAEMKDMAKVIIKWIEEIDIFHLPLWEALPGEGRNIRSIIKLMASSLNLEAKLVDVSITELVKFFSDYLIYEPFWRETSLELSNTNIYFKTGLIPASFGKDFKTCNFPNPIINNFRNKELKFLEIRSTY